MGKFVKIFLGGVVLSALVTGSAFGVSVLIGGTDWLTIQRTSQKSNEVGSDLVLPSGYSSALYGEVLSNLSAGGYVTVDELNAELEEWKKVNGDVCAIIDIPELGIHDPVIQATESNKQWLRTNIYGEEDVAGAVFMDVRSDIEETPLKLVHGHNMKDGSMFANVPKYLKVRDCAEAPVIYWTTSRGTAEYRVFSVISVDSTKEALPIDFIDSFEDIDEILEDLLDRSIVPGGELTGHDCILLNTCWYGKTGEEHNLHCVVVACRAVGKIGGGVEGAQ